MIDTNESLISRLNVDAHDAWREFYQLYWQVILRYARKIGCSETQAHDVLQDTMVVLIRVLPTFVYNRNKGRFRNFLLTIVHRKSLAALRSARRQKVQFSIDSIEPSSNIDELSSATPWTPDEEDSALRHWRECVVESLLEELHQDSAIDERTVRIFDAYAICNRHADEVAAEYGVTTNAVYQIKNRLIRRMHCEARRRLRDSGVY
jgi:RNA polymerase sigma-70 factor (ECF subfamily)